MWAPKVRLEEKWLRERKTALVYSLMSFALLRQAAIPQSLAAARRAASRHRSRCYSLAAAHAQTRHESGHKNAAPTPGPSFSQQDVDIAESASAEPSFKGRSNPEDSTEPFSRVQSYLASINATGTEPTLEDLDQCRPRKQPPPHSPEYIETYRELIQTLCRSFTKEQLRKFLVQTLGESRHSAKTRKKADYAESIIEQLWKWPTLKQLEKARRDRTEIVSKAFPVTASELFLILGRDGMDLLRLSKEYDVHISLQRKPMALHVEGTRGSLKELGERIYNLKQSFVEETCRLPSQTPIPPELVQRVSRLASAYVENVPSNPGTVRIVARDHEGLTAAKRLASRALHELEETSQVPLLAYLPPGASDIAMYPNNYALYPFLSPRSLPFTMNTNGTFRVRRVGEWLTSDFREDTDEQKAALTPPLMGEHPFSKVREWIAQNPVKMTFVPDLPLPLLTTVPEKERVKQRLVYHALHSGASETQSASASTHSTNKWRKYLSLEIKLPDPPTLESDVPRGDMPERDLEEGLSFADLEETQPRPNVQASSESESEIPPILILDPSGVHCSMGVEADLNLMIPDRPIDLQFTARSATVLSEDERPPEFQQFVAELRAYLDGSAHTTDPPSPPLLIGFAGERYILHTNASVRQSEELVSDSGRPTLKELTFDMVEITQALCESTLDLETNQKSMHCEK
ncbi:hypothetical protein BN946_scf184726.g3 [Trametes cinnabarina]|uniref:SLS1 N-terminal domain-containing protein n=1 Tax=Pycnoporus cinnabarinus TaxID=5643 RepID=A0A060T087_PYCCI|nr:hypothetical protein BN946_scf184726.g3 [Trametes cinnabarina]